MPESFSVNDSKSQCKAIENPCSRWHSQLQDYEIRIFTPQTRTNLPELQLSDKQKPFDQTGVRSMVNDVAWILQHDSSYGCPSAQKGQIHCSGGLIESIDFPNNNKTLRINYDDRNTGRIGSIDMDGRTVTFSYDGSYLQGMFFSGEKYREPFTFQPYDDPAIAVSGSKQYFCDPTQLAVELCRFFKS